MEKYKKSLIISLSLSLLGHAFVFFPLSKTDLNLDKKVYNFSKALSQKSSIKVKISKASKKQKNIISTRSGKLKKKNNQKISRKTTEIKEVTLDSGNTDALSKYYAHVRELINKNKHYSKAARRLKHQDTLKVELLIGSDGKIISRKYLEKSFSNFLNDSTETIFAKISSFNKFPEGLKKDKIKVIVPVKYELL